MKKLFLILTAIIINTLIFSISNADDKYFSKIYKEVKESDHKTVISRISKQTGLSDSKLEDILDGTATLKEVKKICANMDRTEIQQCLNELHDLYDFERSVAKIENLEKEIAYATEIWSNGTRADSEFDLVVDLNIIDTIYFGKEARIPNARTYDPFANEGNDMSINPGDNAGINENNTIDDGYDAPPNITDNNGNQNQTIIVCDEDGNCTEIEELPICADPNLIILDDDSNNLANNPNQDNNLGTNQWYRKQDWTGWDYNYQGGQYPSTYTIDNVGADACGGEEVGMFGNMFCVEEFCNGFICIDVEFIKGSPNRNVTKTNCVQCLVNYTSEELEEAYRKKESLNPSKNTPVIWDIRNWFLGIFNIHVFVEKKPPPSGDRTTRDQDYSVAQEIHFIQAESYPIGGSYVHGDGDTDQLMKNRDMLDMLLSADCQNYLNRIPSGALRGGGYDAIDLSTKCAESIKNLKSPLAQANQDLIKKFKRTALENRKTEVKQHYWEEILQLIKEFAGTAEAINNTFMEFPNAQQIDTKKIDCKST